MPEYFPATDPGDLPAGPIGQMSRLEYIALMLNGQCGHPVMHSANPGVVDHANPDVYTFFGQRLIPPGWAQARLTLDAAVLNAGIEWIAIEPGLEGNALRIEYVDGGLAAPTAVDYAAGVITATFDLAAGTVDAAAVIAALAASVTNADFYVQALNVPGSTGAGIVTAHTSALMTGGLGSALQSAELVFDVGVPNGATRFIARKPGTGAHAITVQFVAGLVGTIPVVGVTGNAIRVEVAVGTTTAAHVLQATRASAEAMALVSADLPAYGSTGAGLVTAHGAAPLAGGADASGLRARIGGLLGNITGLTDDAVVVELAALAGLVATDSALVELDICGYANRIWLPVI